MWNCLCSMQYLDNGSLYLIILLAIEFSRRLPFRSKITVAFYLLVRPIHIQMSVANYVQLDRPFDQKQKSFQEKLSLPY